MPSPVVELEDRIGAQLLLAELGLGPAPCLDPRYDVIELRGRGARGVVCRARDRTLDREVAVKLYAPQTDAQLPQEVSREAQALARLDHPNVVRVYDVGAAALVTGNDRAACIYLSMEFIEGRSLRAWRTEAHRSRRELMRVLLAAGEGLAASHEAGLIHRDVKPENIMLDATGRVRIVDFGLARGTPGERPWVWNDDLDPAPAGLAERLTRVGAIPGTLEYMSPEARRGEADATSDQYSFAATAWEALTGELPFDIHQMAREGTASLTLQGGAVLTARLRRVLERALDPKPERRWSSMRVLLRRLRRASGIRWGMALLGLGLIGGLGVAMQRMTPSELMAPSKPTTAASISATPSQAMPTATQMTELEPAACEQVAGRWSLTTVATWAYDSVRWYEVNGYYELDLQPLAGCAARLRVRKTGDSGKARYAPQYVREAEAAVTLQPTPEGVRVSTDVDLSSNKMGRNRYHLEILLDGDQLHGDWRRLEVGAKQVLAKGWLAGDRDTPSKKLRPGPANQPCDSQCRVQCSSALAAQACNEHTCTTADARVDTGCAPMPDFVPPPITSEKFQASALALRLAIPEGDDLTRCSRAAEALEGSWRLLTRRDDDVRSLALELRPAPRPCVLAASLQQPDGTTKELEAVVDGKGAWVLLSPGPTPSVVMSLMGWDPAYGMTTDGSALSAHRNESEL